MMPPRSIWPLIRAISAATNVSFEIRGESGEVQQIWKSFAIKIGREHTARLKGEGAATKYTTEDVDTLRDALRRFAEAFDDDAAEREGLLAIANYDKEVERLSHANHSNEPSAAGHIASVAAHVQAQKGSRHCQQAHYRTRPMCHRRLLMKFSRGRCNARTTRSCYSISPRSPSAAGTASSVGAPLAPRTPREI